MIRTAVMIDGAFYRKRAYYFWKDKTPQDRATELYSYCMRHIKEGNDDAALYRIFYYDCVPSTKQVYHPLLKKAVDLSKSESYKWSVNFYEELKHQRKLALRLGKLAEEQAHYALKEQATKKLCRGEISISDLSDDDFYLSINQKGVDMMIGVDIASVTFKKQVDRIILVSGDSDFVPAAKQARREGIDFILDPMRTPIKPDLYEHIDGIRTKTPKN